MASTNGQDDMEQDQQLPKLQIYPNPNSGVSPFWKEKYEKDAKKYWDVFYKRHQDKFFKDRHYLDKEWGAYFSGDGKFILEVGCGAGNTIFPLVDTFPEIFVYACDFSPRAVNLVKTHKDYAEARVRAFVCDLTADDLNVHIPPSSIDIVTMIFVLSAVSPEKMALVLQNIRKVLRPGGYVLFRDYAIGDLAQERFTCKDQRISKNFYVRGDGTRAFYFSDEFLKTLFEESGFSTKEYGLCCKQVENRSREIVMNRRWVQAVFQASDDVISSETAMNVDQVYVENIELGVKTKEEKENVFDVDISEGFATTMFDLSPSTEIIEVNLSDRSFKLNVLSKEHQHTCKSTGLMLWESAHLMASILERNPAIISGKRVLELGSGCGGICSMVAASSANLVVATDGDTKALDMLTGNVASNLSPPLLSKLITKRLEWGNREHIESIKELNNEGFEVIIGTDVTYVAEAILPLFATASKLIISGDGIHESSKPALILCHIFRRVDEPSLLAAATQFGFSLRDRWPSMNPSGSIISSWFGENTVIPSTALNIMLFLKE